MHSYVQGNDIALVVLETPLKRSETLTPVQYMYSQYKAGDSAYVVGWAFSLQKEEVPIVSTAQCTADGSDTIRAGEICAYGEGLKDDCIGESGTQPTPSWWGTGCANANTYGVYTSWITLRSRDKT
jgi:hypothetical protein